MMFNFLILGAHRSGTTLLTYILNAHPEINCIGEPDAYEIFGGTTPAPTDKPKVGLKVSHFTEYLLNLNVEPIPLVFIDRDLVDIVGSMSSMRCGADTYLTDCVSPQVEGKIGFDYWFDTTYQKETDFIKTLLVGSPERYAAVGALWIKYTNSFRDFYKQRGFPVFIVDYANLVTNPEQEITKLCGFLGVAYDPRMMTFHEKGTGIVSVGGNKDNVPIHAYSVGKGYTTLSEGQISAIKAVSQCS